MARPPVLDVRPAVAAALASRRPVVGMASGPIAHTLPCPTCMATVEQVEAAVQTEGGTLAIVAVVEGRLTVGLELAELERLANGGSVFRATRRDLPTAVARRLTVATAVSASLYVARRAGIRVVAVAALGGIVPPGQHAEDHVWNISADVMELTETPVAVVNSGASNVHHLADTAEILETLRVPVIGYGTEFFPAFYMRAGTYPLPVRANTPLEVAELLNAHWSLDGAGAAVAQPTPADAALSPDELIPALETVEMQAAESRIHRRDLSPYLMDRLNRLTRGKALRAYQAALVANARLAAQVADCVTQLT